MSSLPSGSGKSRLNDERLLYVVLLLVLESVYGWALFAVPGLHTIALFALFTLLMLLHVSLHLAAPQLRAGRWWLPVYFLA